jgi:hypothetical protein
VTVVAIFGFVLDGGGVDGDTAGLLFRSLVNISLVLESSLVFLPSVL